MTKGIMIFFFIACSLNVLFIFSACVTAGRESRREEEELREHDNRT